MALGVGSIHAQASDQVNIPSWLKSAALFWGQGETSDQEFVAALQFLINEGILIIPAAPEPADIGPPIDIPLAINMSFDQTRYNSGSVVRVLMESADTESERIRLGVFDASGNLVHEDAVATNDFGTASSEFVLPTYYLIDERIEATSFFVRDPGDKFTATATVEAIKMDLSTRERILSGDPTPIVIKLSSAVSEDVGIRVFDSDRNVLFEDTATTNDFGTASLEFVAPKYYIEDEPIVVIAFFENAPSEEQKTRASIVPSKVSITLSLDRDSHRYTEGDLVTLTATTDPPVSTKLVFDSGSCLHGGSTSILTGSNGIGTVTVELDPYLSGCFSDEGETIKIKDAHLFEFENIVIYISEE